GGWGEAQAKRWQRRGHRAQALEVGRLVDDGQVRLHRGGLLRIPAASKLVDPIAERPAELGDRDATRRRVYRPGVCASVSALEKAVAFVMWSSRRPPLVRLPVCGPAA